MAPSFWVPRYLLREIYGAARHEIARVHQDDLFRYQSRRASRDRNRPPALFHQLYDLTRRHVSTPSERVRLLCLLRELRRELLSELDWWIIQNSTANPAHRPSRSGLDANIAFLIDKLKKRGLSVDDATRLLAARFAVVWSSADVSPDDQQQLFSMKDDDTSLPIDLSERIERLTEQFRQRYTRYVRRRRRHNSSLNHP